MVWVLELLGSYYVVSCVVAWITSVFLKAAIESAKDRAKFSFKKGFTNGGMPSSHSAWVAAITTSIGLTTGLSPAFYVALIFSLVVMSDAFGIRYNLGEQGATINVLLKKAKKKPIKVLKGHTFPQVLVGAIWGILIPLLLYFVYF